VKLAAPPTGTWLADPIRTPFGTDGLDVGVGDDVVVLAL
jgi:hypothetical protein